MSNSRFKCGFNSLLGVVLAICLFGIVNYISYRHYQRIDISESRFYSLSEKSLQVLEGISNRVDVIVYSRPGRTGYDDIVNLLKEYSSVQPRINMVRIDPDRDIGRAEGIAKQYDLPGGNVVIFDMGGKSRIVKESDILELDKSPLKEGKMPEKVAFRGEQMFTSTLQSLNSDEEPAVYFLQGHGEGNPGDFDPKTGYSRCAEALEGDNVAVRRLDLAETQKVPEDCAALVVAGPTKQLTEQEFALLRDYLENDGSMLLMLESMATTGFKSFMEDWNIEVGRDIVIDKSRTLTGRELFINEYRPHPITRHLEGTTSIFYLPVSIDPLPRRDSESKAADRPHATLLATSSAKGWAETDWRNVPMEFDPEKERAGALGVAAAVEKGFSEDVDVQIKPTRIVVFGDSSFVSNGGLAGANLDFFLASLEWLLEREDLIAIAPKSYGESKLLLTRTQILWLGGLLVLGLPLLVALLGAVVWIFRRR